MSWVVLRKKKSGNFILNYNQAIIFILWVVYMYNINEATYKDLEIAL